MFSQSIGSISPQVILDKLNLEGMQQGINTGVRFLLVFIID